MAFPYGTVWPANLYSPYSEVLPPYQPLGSYSPTPPWEEFQDGILKGQKARAVVKWNRYILKKTRLWSKIFFDMHRFSIVWKLSVPKKSVKISMAKLTHEHELEHEHGHDIGHGHRHWHECRGSHIDDVGYVRVRVRVHFHVNGHFQVSFKFTFISTFTFAITFTFTPMFRFTFMLIFLFMSTYRLRSC